MERRLAAILAADVVGYSRLMEQDEAATLTALKQRRREILQPLVHEHHGRIVKVMGDGVLIEFASAVNAVVCAVELQKKMAKANEEVAEERHIVLRIGINLGDVIVEGSDLYGDGVNTAARLEGIAEPGTIVISGTIFEFVKNKIDVGFDDVGIKNLKNIAEPVRVYRVAGTPRLSGTMPKASMEKPSIAVLPFINMSGNPEQEYLSDGITEDIITELSRFRSLLVMARNSSFAYKGKSIKVQEIAKDLNVAYVIEGSVRKLASRIRITAQLVDTTSGNHIWAERYDQDIHDIFAIQDDIVATIVTRIAGQIATAGTQKTRRKRTDSLAAYEYVLRGMEHWRSREIDVAHDLFKKATAVDPDFAWAHARLAFSYTHFYFRDLYQREAAQSALAQALEAAKKAVALDGNDSECHRALAMVHLHHKSFDLAKHHLEIAAKLNPNDVGLATNRALFEIYTGRPQVALNILDQTERLDPQPPNWHWEVRGLALYQLRHYEEAAAAFERMTATPLYVDRWRAACYAQLGRTEEARSIATEALNRDPRFTLSGYATAEPFQSQASLDHLIEGMRKTGLPE